MTATHTSSANRFQSALRRLRHDYFPGTRFSEPRQGIAVAHAPHCNLTSTFQAVVSAADGGVRGHHALLRAADAKGNAIEPLELFAHAGDGAAVASLDRLARSLHAVNYFGGSAEEKRLFVGIDARMLAAAPDELGRYFDALLATLGVPTSRIVVCLGEAALEDPVTFVRACLAYAIRGYRVLAELRHDAHADLEHVFLGDPHYVAIDASCLGDTACRQKVHAIVDALRQRGIQPVARRVETQSHAEAARDMGFALLQGRYVAEPVLKPALSG